MPEETNTKVDQKTRMAEKVHQQLETEAENRRKLLDSLDPETREFTRRQFADLGLFQ
jgi:hypothetical protein